MRKWLLLLFIFTSVVSRAQTISTFAGNGTTLHTGDGGAAIAAGIDYPYGGAFDSHGNYYFGTLSDDYIRKVTPCGIISTVAGIGTEGYNGDSILATSAELDWPTGIAFDNLDNLYFADALNNRVRKIDVITGLIYTVAGNGIPGYSGDDSAATNAMLYQPNNLCFDKQGNLYIVDNGNYRIRKVNIATGVITTFAGIGVGGYTGDGGHADSAEIEDMYGICIDTTGNIYFEQQGLDARVREIDTGGIITTIAGNGSAITSGDGGPAIDAGLDPFGLVVDKFGNIYVSGFIYNNVRKIDAAGIITTVAGTGIGGFSGDGGPAIDAELYGPYGVAVDLQGNLYIADDGNRRIRKVTFSTSSSVDVIASTGDTVCSGTPVTYFATVAGVLTAVAYQWFVNGSVVVDTNSTYTYIPANGDSISCAISVTGLCNTLMGNTIHMTVTTPVTPSIHITTSADSICEGTAVTLTATPTYGGSSPTYGWIVDGSPVASGNSYTYTPANHDSVRALLTSDMACITTTTASSNTVNFAIQNVLVPSITISGPTDVVEGGDVTFTATVTNAGINPVIRWFNHGSPFYTGPDNTITFIKPYGLDKITAEVIQTSFICNDSAFTADTAYVQAPTAVNNVTAHSGINIYPNPVSNILTIQSSNPINTVSISNIVGQVVYTQNTPTPKAEINITYLPAGVYFVKVNQVYVQKILKQ